MTRRILLVALYGRLSIVDEDWSASDVHAEADVKDCCLGLLRRPGATTGSRLVQALPGPEYRSLEREPRMIPGLRRFQGRALPHFRHL